MSENLSIRSAKPADVPVILELIRELAVYEKLEHAVVGNGAMLAEHLFCETPKVFCLIAEIDGKAAGFALYFYNYSTFLTRHGVYLEDLFVKPEFRAAGVGKALLRQIAKDAVAAGCGRFEWSVLDWNEPAITFYKKIGAEPMDEWTVYRLSGEGLAKFAEGAL
ncbi:MAG: GNAT family N-acetyltransferase [Alphaproteobacteria bacterium]|nr:GNAT family N-acetyltransferase [Alphaproteobacteria bacterium]